jgi:hypothetical protein
MTMRKYFRNVFSFVIAASVSLGCKVANSPQSGTIDLGGRWALTLSGVSATFNIKETADSVSGSADYSMDSGNPPGCGGESLPSRGSVTMMAQVAGNGITGRMSFDGRWTPPFTASIASKDTVRGSLMSVDRGGCAFILVRTPGN